MKFAFRHWRLKVWTHYFAIAIQCCKFPGAGEWLAGFRWLEGQSLEEHGRRVPMSPPSCKVSVTPKNRVYHLGHITWHYEAWATLLPQKNPSELMNCVLKDEGG